MFTNVTYQMSQSGTPTLPWAILMYQLMQESLTSNIVNNLFSSHMCTTCRKVLDKLEHYYDIAKLNHSNVLATSKYSQCTSSVWHNTHSHCQFCIQCYKYPGLSWLTMMLISAWRRYWNTTIPNMQRQCLLLAAPPPTNISSSTSDNSFLASITHCPIASTSTAATQPALKLISEHE